MQWRENGLECARLDEFVVVVVAAAVGRGRPLVPERPSELSRKLGRPPPDRLKPSIRWAADEKTLSAQPAGRLQAC